MLSIQSMTNTFVMSPGVNMYLSGTLIYFSKIENNLSPVTLEVQSKDVMEKAPKMKLKESRLSSSTTAKSTTIETTTTMTSKMQSKWLAKSNSSSATPSDKLKPLITHELSVVSNIFSFLYCCVHKI